MKIITSLIFFLAVCAFPVSSQYHWNDENGCSYCLYGRYNDGKCVHISREPCYHCYYDDFSIHELNGNLFRIDYSYQSALHVFCNNPKNYCKTINDSIVMKLMPSLKERKIFCKDEEKKSKNEGMFYDLPIPQEDLEFYCDFVKFDNKKSILKVFGSGTCPVRVKGGLNVTRTFVFHYHNLYISKIKKFKIERADLYTQSFGYQKVLFRNLLYKNNFFTLGDCSNSTCEILNYIEEQPQDFDIKCDFIKKKDGQIGKVQVLGEGVCPIEIKDKDEKKQVFYVRSVKDSNGYKLLMTNKRK